MPPALSVGPAERAHHNPRVGGSSPSSGMAKPLHILRNIADGAYWGNGPQNDPEIQYCDVVSNRAGSS